MTLETYKNDDGTVHKSFWCLGCDMPHTIPVKGDSTKMPIWGFNNDDDKPTFTPSINVKINNSICHSFVKNGAIQYLNDCTHKLKSTTVVLPDFHEILKR